MPEDNDVHQDDITDQLIACVLREIGIHPRELPRLTEDERQRLAALMPGYVKVEGYREKARTLFAEIYERLKAGHDESEDL